MFLFLCLVCLCVFLFVRFFSYFVSPLFGETDGNEEKKFWVMASLQQSDFVYADAIAAMFHPSIVHNNTLVRERQSVTIYFKSDPKRVIIIERVCCITNSLYFCAIENIGVLLPRRSFFQLVTFYVSSYFYFNFFLVLFFFFLVLFNVYFIAFVYFFFGYVWCHSVEQLRVCILISYFCAERVCGGALRQAYVQLSGLQNNSSNKVPLDALG